MSKLFQHIYQFFSTRKLIGLCVLLGLIVGLIGVAFQIQFEEDITKLIPSNDDNAEAQNVMKSVNFADKIIVNIKCEPTATLDDLTAYASQLIDSIETKVPEYVKLIQGTVGDDDITTTLDFVYNNLPLFLNDKDYATIAKKLSADSIAKQTASNYKTLVSPTGLVAKKTIVKDPLGLSFIGLKKLQELNFGADFTLHNGFLISPDKQHVLIFITPKLKSSETGNNAFFAEQLYAISENLNAEFSGKVYAEYFGGTLVAVANAKQIKHDIQFTISIAITVLLIILMVFYRRLTIPLILFTPTVVGGLLAITVLYLVREKISAISLGIGSVLLGVTLDYSLHILTHIRSHSSIKALYKDITKPILMSSLTTAVAFLCLLFLKSQALQDLGIFAAVSVIGASVFALLFIPQVYRYSATTTSNTFIDKASKLPLHKYKWMVLGVVAIAVISMFTYGKVGFNNNLASLNFEPEHLKQAQLRLDKLTNTASKSIYLAAYGATESEALKTSDAIYKQLQDFKTKGLVVNYSSVSALVKSSESQQHKINQWNTFWSDSLKQGVKSNLITSGQSFGFKPKTFNTFYQLLDKPFKPLTSTEFKGLKTITLDDYIAGDDAFSVVTTLVKVKSENVNTVLQAFEGVPKTLIIDRQKMNETFLGNLKNDFNSLVVYSLVAVFMLLLIFYRRLSLTLITALPIALTWLVTIGVMGVLNIQFNIFNIIISSFIFGLGVDYCIFITNGLLHEYRYGEVVLPTHKASIILSVLTTVLGVGVLIFAKHPALYSMSLVCVIGIVSALVIAFTIQPLLFKLFVGSKTRRPISLRYFLHAIISFGYFGIGGFLISILGVLMVLIIPISKKIKMRWFHKIVSKFMKSVLYTNPFVSKKVINNTGEDFSKQAMIIANHMSFLDILAVGMLHPKIIYLVNDWVYNSPIFGKAVKLAGFYPVSNGIDQGVEHLQKKVDQGYSLMAFPEGTRSLTNTMKRFHKGAFFLAEQFQLDIVPVLIHGNSEVNPKGSFVIKDGSITLQILPRIKYTDRSYGDDYTSRTKAISKYFKTEFKTLRSQLEDERYFNAVILEDFMFKGDALYNTVKLDLEASGTLYKTIVSRLNTPQTIVHLSNHSGQLDYWLVLDNAKHKITVCLNDDNTRAIAKNTYLVNTHYKINVVDAITPEHYSKASVLIIDYKADMPEYISESIMSVVLLKEGVNLSDKFHAFKPELETKELVILQRK